MNIEQVRFNMVEQQVRPWNVLNPAVLDALLVVKREQYFPAGQETLALSDTELPLPDGQRAFTPKLEARVVQEVAPNKHEGVLLIGAGAGSMAALLAHQARHVTVLESSAAIYELAAANLAKNGVRNVDISWNADPFSGQHTGNYDVIVVAGGLESVPESIKKLLNVGGRMLVFLGRPPVQKAELFKRTAPQSFTHHTLFETLLPIVHAAPLGAHFRF